MLADDLCIKFNELQTVINERFKFLKTKKERGSAPSKLTCLLRLYYEKGCKSLKKQQVEKLADDSGFTRQTLLNRWIKLKGDGYSHNANTNNVREFMVSYEALLEIFKNDINLFNNVKNCYDQLKETYPELTY